MVWASSPYPFDEIEKGIDILSSLSGEMDREKIVAAMKEIVPEFVPLNSPEKQ